MPKNIIALSLLVCLALTGCHPTRRSAHKFGYIDRTGNLAIPVPSSMAQMGSTKGLRT